MGQVAPPDRRLGVCDLDPDPPQGIEARRDQRVPHVADDVGIARHPGHVAVGEIPEAFEDAADALGSLRLGRQILETVKMFLRGETLPWTEIDGPEWRFDPPRKRSLEHEMLQVLTSEGFDAAVTRYREIREKFDGQLVYDFREAVLNDLGYKVLRGGVVDVELAINIFRLNTVGYPESFNTWDSLAEGYMENGDFMNAVKYYEKSLEINPNNGNAVEVLERIREQSD